MELCSRIYRWGQICCITQTPLKKTRIKSNVIKTMAQKAKIETQFWEKFKSRLSQSTHLEVLRKTLKETTLTGTGLKPSKEGAKWSELSMTKWGCPTQIKTMVILLSKLLLKTPLKFNHSWTGGTSGKGFRLSTLQLISKTNKMAWKTRKCSRASTSTSMTLWKISKLFPVG